MAGAFFKTPGASLHEVTVYAQSASSSTARSTNLQALPKDISAGELNKLMVQYSQYLGVPCSYCHELDFDSNKIDYVSDQNPHKATARVMITMTNDINNKYLSQLGESRYADPITCGNCHMGQTQPPAFEPKPLP